MPGSKTNVMNRKDVLAAVRAIPVEKNFVWDGKNEAIISECTHILAKMAILTDPGSHMN